MQSTYQSLAQHNLLASLPKPQKILAGYGTKGCLFEFQAYMFKLAFKDLVLGLPKLNFVKEKPCKACQLGKQTKVLFKNKTVNSNNRPLQLLHMDLFGPILIISLGVKDIHQR